MLTPWQEAGCEILDLMPISTYWSSPGGTSELVHLYCGRVDATDAGGIHGLPEEHEDIRVLTVSLQDAFDAINTGRINNSATIIALQWLALNLETVKQKWSMA